jgi:hypothetical protein
MSQPTTTAGRSLDAQFGVGQFGRVRDLVLAIEAEARADALREVAERVMALPPITEDATVTGGFSRAAVLAILDAALPCPDTETAGEAG